MVNSRRAVQSVATEIQARVASEAVAAVRDAVNVVVQVVAYQREMFAVSFGGVREGIGYYVYVDVSSNNKRSLAGNKKTGKWSMSVDREASTMKGMLRVLQSFQTWTTSVYAYTYPDGALNGWTYPIGTADNDDRTLRKWVQTGSLFQVFTCRDDGSVVNLDVSRMVPKQPDVRAPRGKLDHFAGSELDKGISN
ncbi:hypothetical protein DFJ73DRAFT_517126 [Zopfochytrium polystomum]|nr:hypothetical protein DFJ73DRAFT_517126 [Zopfochytrium polystomum]